MIWTQPWYILALSSHIFCSIVSMFCVHSILSLESLPLASDIGPILFLPLTCHHLCEGFLAAIGGSLNNLCAFWFSPLTLATCCDYLSKCVFYCNYLHECHCLSRCVNTCIPEHVLSLHSREESRLFFHSTPPYPPPPQVDNSLFSGLASQILAAMGCEENCRMHAFFRGLGLGLVGLRPLVALQPFTFPL